MGVAMEQPEVCHLPVRGSSPLISTVSQTAKETPFGVSFFQPEVCR